jgi:Ring finger domain
MAVWNVSIRVLLFALANSIVCDGVLYIGNNETFPSQPALFGRSMADGKLYQARLQFFHDNPSLCTVDDKTKRRFVVPEGVQAAANLTLPVFPVAILVSRGNCPFQQKAVNAELLHPSIEFLIVYNVVISNGEEDEDTLVSMYSEGFSRLVLLSVSHRTGQSLKQYLAKQDDATLALGGPIVQLDAQVPLGYGTASVQSMILSAMGLFFMLLSFAGCIVILAGTFAQLSNGASPIARRTVLNMAEIEQLAEATTGECAICLDTIDGSNSGNSLPCGHVYHKECLVPWLTERQAKCPLCKMDLLEFYEQQRQQRDPTARRPFWLRLPYTQVEQHEVELQSVGRQAGVVEESSSSVPLVS